MNGNNLGLALAAIFSLATVACDRSKPEVRLESAWARRAPMVGDDAQSGVASERGNGAVYATVVNAGKTADVLIAGASEAADAVELHESYEMSGMMMMRPAPKLEILAGSRLEMKPGGYHLMLLRLKRDLAPGEKIKVSLTFEKAGQLSVDAEVR